MFISGCERRIVSTIVVKKYRFRSRSVVAVESRLPSADSVDALLSYSSHPLPSRTSAPVMIGDRSGGQMSREGGAIVLHSVRPIRRPSKSVLTAGG